MLLIAAEFIACALVFIFTALGTSYLCYHTLAQWAHEDNINAAKQREKEERQNRG